VRAIVVLAVVFVASGLAACVPTASDREVRLGRLAAEHKQLMDELDVVQARLLVADERVRFWEEMRARHQSVSAIACTSQEAHAVAMAENLLLERRPAARMRARVASVRGAPTSMPARR
jgi:hypothetical protein